jgi:hypothetical protein
MVFNKYIDGKKVICLKRFFPVLLIASLVLFSSCGTRYDPFDPPESGTTATPTDWVTPGSGVFHENTADVSPEKMPAQHIDLPASQQESFIRPLSDGGCLAVSQVPLDTNDTSGYPLYDLRAIRFASDGSVIWDRTFTDGSFKGYIVSVCVFPDDGFILSLRVLKDSSVSYDTVDVLRRFLPDGTPSWRSSGDDITSGALDYVFVSSDGAVLTAGTVSSIDRDGSYAGNDIVMMRFDENGSLSKKISAGTFENDYLTGASYADGTGLVLIWKNQARCFDDALDMKWTLSMTSGENLFEVKALSDGVLASGTIPVDAGDPEYSGTKSAVFFIDSKGIWKMIYSVVENRTWITSSARLPDGRTVAGIYMVSDDNKQTTEIMVSNVNGSDWIQADTIPGIVQRIIPTGDGGFTAIAHQTVKQLPQPPYISSVWTDTEAIAAHYDGSLHLVWKRKIDQYKDVLRTDILIPTSDDRLLIG